jgi:hypothetical protein
VSVLRRHLFDDFGAGMGNLWPNTVAGKNSDQGVQGLVSSKRLIASSSFFRKPS